MASHFSHLHFKEAGEVKDKAEQNDDENNNPTRTDSCPSSGFCGVTNHNVSDHGNEHNNPWRSVFENVTEAIIERDERGHFSREPDLWPDRRHVAESLGEHEGQGEDVTDSQASKVHIDGTCSSHVTPIEDNNGEEVANYTDPKHDRQHDDICGIEHWIRSMAVRWRAIQQRHFHINPIHLKAMSTGPVTLVCSSAFLICWSCWPDQNLQTTWTDM